MQNFIKYVMGILLMTAPTIIVPEGVEAQLGKIHRKYAQVTVSPEVVTQGDTFFVTVHPWLELEEWKLVVLDGGEEISSKSFAFTQVSQHSFEFMNNNEGVKTIQLHGKEYGQWRVLQEKNVEFLPGFYDEVQTVNQELQKFFESGDIDPFWVSTARAYAEDLMERMKASESGQGWGLKNRLNELKEMVAKVKENKDPYEGKTGYQLRGYWSADTGGDTQPFSLYVPNGYDPEKKYPMVVMLHGAWSNHHLAMRRVMGHTNNRGENDVAAKRTMPQLPDVPYLVLAPNGFETMGYHTVAYDDVLYTISRVGKYFSVDENRIYLTGLSMGGGGTGKFGMKHARLFAAIAPVCGYFDLNFRGVTNDQPEFVKRLVELKSPINMAENLLHVPVKLMHGEVDGVVPVKQSQDLHEKLRELDYHSELEVYPGVGHDAWTDAYEDARIFDWFSQFEREQHPKHVRNKRVDYAGSHWVSVWGDKFRRFTSVDGEIKDDGIYIKTENAKTILLRLTKDYIPMNKDKKLVIDESSTITFTPNDYLKEGSEESNLPLIKLENKWVINKDHKVRKFVLKPSVDGLTAPMTSKHIYLYGSNGTSDEVQQAQSLAMEKAFWGDMTDVNWDVLPEEQYKFEGSDHLSGIVLFSKVNNSAYIQDHIKHLPIEVKGEQIHFGDRVVEKDQGFIFVYPMHGKSWYTTICTATTNKGMKALEKFAKERYSFLGNTYGDFVCMDKDGNPIWGGLFDKDWKIETIEDYK